MTPDKLLLAGLYLIPALPVALVVQYLRLRVQNLTAARPDPELGRKAVCHLFLTASVLIGLVGATGASADLMDRAFQPLKQAQAPAGGAAVPTPWFNPTQRAAAALVLAGLLHGTLFAVVLRVWTNDRTEPAVRRGHYGLRLVIAGMFWMIADTGLLLVLFEEGNTDWNRVATLSAIAIVWGPAAAVHLWLLLRDGRRRPAEEDAGSQ